METSFLCLFSLICLILLTSDWSFRVNYQDFIVGQAVEMIVHSKTENQEAIQEVIYHMIETITAYYNALFSQESPAPTLRNTSKEMFDRFLYLVNNHCREHRQLAFYAEKICVTERYLGTVIRQTSGQTAKEWIDKAVIIQAKVMLRHSNLQVAEIAERLKSTDRNKKEFPCIFQRFIITL